MSVVVLCAGLGTRLLPLTARTAKPLVPVGDRPALAHILERARAFGGPLAVNAHHHEGPLRAYLRESAPDAVVSYEDVLLDTGGGVRRALEVLERERGFTPDDVLVWNGDALLDPDLSELRAAHAAGPGPAGATLVVGPPKGPRGNVGVDADGRVVRLRGETVRAGEVRSADFLCVQVLGRAMAARLPERGGLVESFYLPLLGEGARVDAFHAGGRFHDIGALAVYLEANLAWLEDRGRAHFVAEGARVAEGVRLDAAIVGAGARVSGEGALARSVVWPGAHAVAPLRDAIVTPWEVVPVRA